MTLHDALTSTCWQASERDVSGRLQPHPERFPDGTQPLVEYAHARGPKLVIHSDAGYLVRSGFNGPWARALNMVPVQCACGNWYAVIQHAS